MKNYLNSSNSKKENEINDDIKNKNIKILIIDDELFNLLGLKIVLNKIFSNIEIL